MYAVTHVRNVFGVAVRKDFDACAEWLDQQAAQWQLFYPDDYVNALHNGIAGEEFAGPWLIFVSDDTVAVAFKLKFC